MEKTIKTVKREVGRDGLEVMSGCPLKKGNAWGLKGKKRSRPLPRSNFPTLWLNKAADCGKISRGWLDSLSRVLSQDGVR